ncbi:MAG TPA: polynucleotide adenylyltransferase PcnB [Gammaproteobacteria bacterium]|jgi:poly(A) polymerase|nr:polynucleotide adenylyltransferase PcnB [Gammaproteobacteria bacterium]HAO70260.1 polynucleotide adenylyltransferase PcnB [Gammaproteobacteria bacterium]HAP92296.1 polynucleotide adenylyltransferase PcnB [Gammaproteobacteria bacterium]HCF47928.1 polynucleotide adenylyltransferase PcnB [Gammaproteobacteria bacterium]HCJ13671.1 polynucleotide adenylyltransferase PcnB [Gammaproteobacteria bacterium]
MKPIRQSIKFDKKFLDKDALKVVNTIHKAGFEVYLVGGCVRDLLLGLEPKDFDIATNAKPEQVHKLFKRSRLIGRRFRLVHVMFSARKFIEVATFRSGQVQTAKSGVIVRDNCYGNLEDDVVRRDFNINALYYDIHKHEVIDYVGGLKDLEAREIHIIGEAKLRFSEDPVRMIRAVRFGEKLGAELSDEVKNCILDQAPLLSNISPARLYEECIKLFHNEYSFEVYEQLEKYGLLKHLFKQTHKNDFIKKALLNTAARIKQNKPVTPAFLFAVFLWQAQNERFVMIKKKQRSFYLAMTQASEEVIINQIKQVSLPKWLTARIKDIWIMQSKLEKMHPKKVDDLLQNPRFRMAYDFLLLRSQSINPELEDVAKFWTKAQQ